MKQLFKILLSFCSIFILYGAVFAAQTSAQNKPVAFISNPDYKFPSVLEGTEITHEFVIQNNGDAVLNIENVLTT